MLALPLAEFFASRRSGDRLQSRSAAVPEEPKREKPRPAPRRKPAAKSKAAEEDATIPQEEMIDEPPVPAPAPPPPAKKSPPLPKKSPPPKRAAKSQGVFDVDFFDPEEKETSPEIEESDEIEDDESLWQEEEVEDMISKITETWKQRSS